jgi:hypothetical protein
MKWQVEENACGMPFEIVPPHLPGGTEEHYGGYRLGRWAFWRAPENGVLQYKVVLIARSRYLDPVEFNHMAEY